MTVKGSENIEEQREYFPTWVYLHICFMVGHRINSLFLDRMLERVKRRSGRNVHNEVLTSMMNAPINLFYDVTPIGLILNRIRGDINVFRGGLFHVYQWIGDMSSHFFYLFCCFYFMQSYTLMFSVAFIIWTVSQYAMPMNIAKKKMSKVSHTVHSPVSSYFFEAMNGITIIRAFGQNQTVINKQYKLLDMTTQQGMYGHALHAYSENRIVPITRLLFLAATIAAVQMKGHISSIIIFQTLDYADAPWLIHLFHCLEYL